MLYLPHLHQPIVAHIFDDKDLSLSLLSISDLCNAGCTAIFTDQRITIKYNECIVVDDAKSPNDPLWHVASPTIQPASCASSVTYTSAPQRKSTDDTFVRFIHASFGSPSISTLTHAIRSNYLPSLSRLTAAMLAAHPPHTIPTALGHLDQIRQGQKSTKRFISLFADETLMNSDHTPSEDNAIDNNTYTHVFALNETMHSDLTGKFPVISFSGMQYLIVSVMDGYVHVEPMRNRHHVEYVAAYKRTVNFFSKLGRKPVFQRLDNETSTALETFARVNDISIQYCALHQHRALRAERAIRTFKNHFIATLCTVADDFPLGLWDELLPQAELCLNHLLPYPSNTSISAYAGLHGGAFDFAAHPVAPAGTKIIIHDKPTIRASWAPHGTHGYYLGPAQSHYRCYRVWATNTRSIRITDTVAWFLQGLQLPGPSAHDLFCTAVADLTHAINQLFSTTDTNAPLHPTGHLLITLTDTLRQLASMYPRYDNTASAEIETEISVAPQAQEQRVAQESTITEISIPDSQQQSAAVTTSELVVTDERIVGALSESSLLSIDIATPQPTNNSQAVPSPSTILTEESVATPNTSLTAKCRPRHTVPRPPLFTDRVTRLDAQRISSTSYALQMSATLNLDAAGRPLRYRSAKNGPNTIQWQRAEGEEIQRLIDTGTIRAIHLSEQPTERKGKSTYYNPQVKEKEAADGTTTYRVRGTIGATRSPTLAQLRLGQPLCHW